MTIVSDERNAIFDPAPYINKATIDGNLADEIEAKFTGSWEPPVEWFDGAQLGRTKTLHVEVEVTKRAGSVKDGEDANVVGTVTLKVIDVYLPAPEDL